MSDWDKLLNGYNPRFPACPDCGEQLPILHDIGIKFPTNVRHQMLIEVHTKCPCGRVFKKTYGEDPNQ